MNTKSIVEIKNDNEGNSVFYSKFKHESFTKKTINPTIGIKYVIEGVENYAHDSHNSQVHAEHYLLFNAKKEYEVCVEYTRAAVSGLCINLTEDIINDVLYNFQHEENYLLDNPFHKPGQPFDFLEGVYKKDNILSQHLKSLIPHLNQEDRVLNIGDRELYYGIASKLLASQKIVAKEICGIKLQGIKVRKELYTRLLLAKTIIEETNENIKISDVASESALSEFHFFRTFKQAFGISPHQFQIKVKLDKAAKMLAAGDMSIENVAYNCGFTDIFTFSKTFKKHFNYPPSFYKKNYLSEKSVA